MKKNSKILMVLAIALVFTIAAGICAYQILSPQRTTIYVFNKNYKAGTTLTSDMFTPIQVDSKIVVAGAGAPISHRFITQAEFPTLLRANDSLKSDVGEGTPLVISLLSVTGGNAIEMSMQATAIAVTVDVNSTTGVTNDLAPGASVNVYVTYKKVDFYREHPIIRFDTLVEGFGEYEIFAVFKVYPADFRFHHFINAYDEDAFDEYINRCRKLSFYDTDIVPVYGDRLLALSTCEYSREGNRLVVVARQISSNL